MKYKCLVFDHDDTTVDSTRNVHYPSFVEFMKIYRPSLSFSLEDYIRLNFDPGVIPLFRDICGLSEKEMMEEQDFWVEYTKNHVSKAFEGIREIMEEQKRQGGLIVVVSHSFAHNIQRDYQYNGLPDPDMIFGWEQPKEERKPSPCPLYKIMDTYHLQPEEILVIDDLKPGLDMARAAKVDFAGAGWCYDIPENESFMKENADHYFKTVEELKAFLQ